MKRLLSSILVIILSFSAVSVSVSASTTPSDWALDEVNNAVSAGLVTDSVRKDYQADITREQFCEMVVLAYEKISNNKAEMGNITFSDTDNAEILKAANLGIVSGYGDGIFAPDDLITREQIATMLVRMIDCAVTYENVSIYNNNYFADGNSISDWAVSSVNFAYDKRLMQGVGDNRIDPQANTTCEQAVLLVYRTFEKYNDNNSMWTDSFTDRKVYDEKTALSVIDELSDKIGIKNVDDEIIYDRTDETPDNTFYNYKQMYNNVPVYGRSITIGTDDDGNCNILSENYKALDVNMDINIDKESVCKIIRDTYEDNIESIFVEDLTIYSLFDVEPQLCWKTYVNTANDTEYFFVSANSGDIIAQSPLRYYDTVRGTGNDIDNKERTFNTYTEDYKTYYMADEEIGVTVYDANNGTLKAYGSLVDENDNLYKYYDEKDGWFNDRNEEVTVDADESGNYMVMDKNGNIISDNCGTAIYLTIEKDILQGTPWGRGQQNNIFASLDEIKNKSEKWNNKKAVTLMTRIEDSYAFYDELFRRKRYNGNSGEIFAVINDNIDGDYTNAYSFGDWWGQTVLSFGTNSSLSYDIIGHEYRHSVTASIKDGLSYESESGALNEAYSDIFGELFEDWVDDRELNNSCDWVHNNKRSLVNPIETNDPDYYKGANWVDTENTDEHNDYGGVHTNQTVISHAAYLMSTGLDIDDSIEHLTNLQLADLFYNTSFVLPCTCSFEEFSKLFYMVANDMRERNIITEKQLLCIARAFQSVGLPITSQSVSGRVVDNDGNGIDQASVCFSINGVPISLTETDRNGNFSIMLPVGTYEIQITKDGYNTATQGANVSINTWFILLEDIVLEKEDSKNLEDMLLNVFIDRVVGQNSDYLYFLPDDYDGDGLPEAFGITGWGLGEDIYSNVDIWFIDSQGNCSLVKSDIYGFLVDPITTSNGKFINWYWTAGGSGGSSIILGCKGGQSFEPRVSGKYDSFVYRDTASDVSDFEMLNCDYIGYSGYFKDGGGHMWRPVAFDYNTETREFIERTSDDFDKLLVGDFSAAAGTYINALGDEIVLLDNGLDTWSAENDDFRYKAEGMTKSPDGAYSWGILSYYNGEPLGGYGITLYPIGTDVTTLNGTVVNTDKSRIRLWAGNGSVTEDADYIYYKQ